MFNYERAVEIKNCVLEALLEGTGYFNKAVVEKLAADGFSKEEVTHFLKSSDESSGDYNNAYEALLEKDEIILLMPSTRSICD